MKIRRILIVGILVAALLVVQAGVVFAQEDTTEPPEEPSTEETQEPLMPGQNPVAYFMAGVMDVTYDEVRELQQEGYGYGNISKAYYLCSLLLTLPPEGEETAELTDEATDETTAECGPEQLMEYLDSAKGMGWGNVIKQFRADHPELMATNGHGVGWLFKYAKGMTTTEKHHGKPEWAGGPKDHTNNGKDKNKD